MRQLPDGLRSNWCKAYEWWHAAPPSGIYLHDITELQQRAGLTDELIVAVIERGLKTNRKFVLAWAKRVLEGLVPYEITTVEQWQAFEAEQASEEGKERERRAPGPPNKPGRGQPIRPRSGVFLQREKKDDDYYDHIHHKFGK